MTVQRNDPRFCTGSICGWNLFHPLGLGNAMAFMAFIWKHVWKLYIGRLFTKVIHADVLRSSSVLYHAKELVITPFQNRAQNTRTRERIDLCTRWQTRRQTRISPDHCHTTTREPTRTARHFQIVVTRKPARKKCNSFDFFALIFFAMII